jgi:ActR/RegA family two-component response regulator
LLRRMLYYILFGHLSSPSAAAGPAGGPAPPATLSELERAHIQRVLQQMEGNVTRAATALGIDRRTLQRKLRGYGLPDE